MSSCALHYLSRIYHLLHSQVLQFANVLAQLISHEHTVNTRVYACITCIILTAAHHLTQRDQAVEMHTAVAAAAVAEMTVTAVTATVTVLHQPLGVPQVTTTTYSCVACLFVAVPIVVYYSAAEHPRACL
jgi:hypothetical protein